MGRYSSAHECVTYNQWNFEDCSGINMDALLDCETPSVFMSYF